ncbi:MAG: LysR family transcriptional regulator [Pseudomonadota bacterium]
MKLNWLEDFLLLIETGSFSKAAERRNVTQPAFSRRIQMLEQWLGVQLVNRGSHSLKLTTTAARFEPVIRRVIESTYELRSHMRADAAADSRFSLATQHTLMVSHLPKLLNTLQEYRHETAFQVRTGDLGDCIEQLSQGHADLLLSFRSEEEPRLDQTSDFSCILLGHEYLLPVGTKISGQQIRTSLQNGGNIRLLKYPEDSFLGRILRRECLLDLVKNNTIETVCESAFTMGIKEMAISDMGLSWLPKKIIEDELMRGKLISLENDLKSIKLDVCLYCSNNNKYPKLRELWDKIQSDRIKL